MADKRSVAELLRSSGDDLLSLMRFRSQKEAVAIQAAGESDMELRQKLNQALNAVEPGFLGVMEVYPSEKIVIYAVAPEDSIIHYRRSYTDDGDVAINTRKTEVEPVTEWKPVHATTAEATAAAGTCGCGKPVTPASSQQGADSATGEVVMHKHAERITALIANKNTPWREADRAHLETVGDERLREEEQFAATAEERARIAEEAKRKEEEEKNKQPGTTSVAGAVPPQSTAVAAARAASAAPAAAEDPDAWKKNAPQNVLDMLEAKEQADTKRRAEMLKALSAHPKVKGTAVAKKLEAKSNEELEEMMTLLAEPEKKPLLEGADFGGRALAGQRRQQEDEEDENSVPPAPKVSELIRSNRAKAAAAR